MADIYEGRPISDIDLGPFGVKARIINYRGETPEVDAIYSRFEITILEEDGTKSRYPWMTNPYVVSLKVDNTTPVYADGSYAPAGAAINNFDVFGEKDWLIEYLKTEPLIPYLETVVDVVDAEPLKRFDRYTT